MNKVLRSLRYACFGLKFCFETQRNMIIHAVIGAAILILGAVLRVSLTGMLFLLSAVMIVLVAEAFNTALEKTIDIYTKERNHLAQTAKDVAAGAVLLTTIFAVLVGLVVLGPPLWRLLAGNLFGYF